MTRLFESLPLPAAALIGLALGLVLGIAHFASLKRVTALYVGGGTPWRAIAFQLGRLALLTAVLTGLALMGTVPLLAGALGVLVGRAIVLHRARKVT